MEDRGHRQRRGCMAQGNKKSNIQGSCFRLNPTPEPSKDLAIPSSVAAALKHQRRGPMAPTKGTLLEKVPKLQREGLLWSA